MISGERAALSRRRFLQGVGLAAGTLAVGGVLQACASSTPAVAPTSAPAANPTPVPATASAQAQAAGGSAPAAPADWQARWDTLQAAAKQEGQVAVIVPPGDVYSQFVNSFQEKFGVQVTTYPGNGTDDIVPKVVAERAAGQFNWDVMAHSPGNEIVGFMPIGAADPIPPVLILPEVLDDSKWFKGFQSGWVDLKQQSCYGYTGFVSASAKINRDVVPESQLSTLDQLWDPQWKGKIAMYDPRVGGAGQQAAAVWMIQMGPDKLRDFLQNQQPTVTQDRRQLGEWLVRGEYPIGIGVAPDSLSPLTAQGVDVSIIKPLDVTNPNGIYLSHGTGSLGLMNKAPHPNAAALFANWILTQDAQALWGTLTGYNSRRLDVPPADPQYALNPDVTYVFLEHEENYNKRNAAADIAKQVLA